MRRGSAPGERRGGRQKGTPNKTTGEIREVARRYGPAVIERLAKMSGIIPGTPADSYAVQVAAMKELLDRGYGRATLPTVSDEDGTTITMLHLSAARTVSAGLGRAPMIDDGPDAGRDAQQLAYLLSAPRPKE